MFSSEKLNLKWPILFKLLEFCYDVIDKYIDRSGFCVLSNKNLCFKELGESIADARRACDADNDDNITKRVNDPHFKDPK